MAAIIEIYQDDLTIFLKERSSHVGHLRQIFERCRKYGISLNPAKSVLGIEVIKVNPPLYVGALDPKVKLY